MQKKLIVLLLTSSVALCQESPSPAQNETAIEKAEIAQLNKELTATQQKSDAQESKSQADEKQNPQTPLEVPVKLGEPAKVVTQEIETKEDDVQKEITQATETQEEKAPDAPPIIEEQQVPSTETPQEDDEIEIKNINTVDIREPKGNWLYKRIWWEKAERVYEKIKQLADKIMEFRLDIFNRRNELNRSIIDPFYAGLSLERGGLEEVIISLLQKIDEQKKQVSQEPEETQQSAQRIEEKKKMLEELQEDAQKIVKIDRAIDDALMRLVEQTNQIKYYEQQAWESFKAINRELSDKKARELYYAMDTYWKNLNNINNYLSDPYSKYFDQLLAKIQQEIENLKNSIHLLSQKGIDLSAHIKRMRAAPTPSKEVEPQSEESEEQGFLYTIWGWIKAPFIAIGTMLTGFYDSIAGLFGGGITSENDTNQAESEETSQEEEVTE